MQAFMDNFTQTTHDIIRHKCDTLICGDFNIDLLKHSTNLRSNDFLKIILSSGFLPTLSCPTRFSDMSASLIDNILYYPDGLIESNVRSGIFLEKLSDHQAYFLCLDSRSKIKNRSRFINVAKRTGDYADRVREDLTCINLMEKLRAENDPDDNYQIFSDSIQAIIEKHIETKRVRFNKYRHKKSPWITQGILKSIKFRDKLYRKKCSTPVTSPAHLTYKINLATYNKILKKIMRASKAQYYFRKFDQCKGNSKQTWKHINEVLGRHVSQVELPGHLIYEGQRFEHQSQVLDCFNLHFSSVGRKLAEKHSNCDSHFTEYMTNPTNTVFEFKLVEKRHVEEIIQYKLKSKSSFGEDGISSSLLKKIYRQISEPLTFLINQTLITGAFPKVLKIARVKALFKKGNIHDPANYRPISLLSTFSKVYEKVILYQLSDYFEEQKLLFNSQYGFRQNHSTDYAVLELVDQVSSLMDQNKIPFSIFIDLSKAFDCLDHDILIQKLAYYGVRGNALALMRNYLSDRKQSTHYESEKSKAELITTGVPQGSILGPFLFLVYMNDLAASTDLFSIINYADDTALTSTISSAVVSNELNSINNQIKKVTDWLTSNKLTINESKSKVIFYHTKQRIFSPPAIKINGEQIESVTEFNYLGIRINKHLTWDSHANFVSGKICKVISTMRRLKNYIPSFILKVIYDSLIGSIISYGLLIWGSCSGGLAVLQRKAVRLIVNAKYNSHTDPIFRKLGILKISDQRKLQELSFYYKYKHDNVPYYFRHDFITYHRDISTRTTRNQHLLVIPRIRHEYMRNILRYSLVKTVNESSELIISKIHSHSIKGFCNYVKHLLIQSYNEICSIPNCYICNR